MRTANTTSAQLKASAAEAVTRAYARHGPEFVIRVQSLEKWETEGQLIAERDGCSLLEGMYRSGFVHSHVSLPPIRRKP